MAAGASACGGTPEAAPPPREVVDLAGCLGPKAAALSAYDDDDVKADVGIQPRTGPVPSAGVVISYESQGSVCPWLPLADALTKAGYAVLLYERIDGPEEEFVQPMVSLLRKRGVDRVGLVGGSIGGMVSIYAAEGLRPRPDVVVSLSGADLGTVDAAPKLTMPLLVVAARGDSTFSGPAEQTYEAATASRRREIMVLDGNAHASVMFSTDARVLPRVVRFVETAMPVR